MPTAQAVEERRTEEYRTVLEAVVRAAQKEMDVRGLPWGGVGGTIHREMDGTIQVQIEISPKPIRR